MKKKKKENSEKKKKKRLGPLGEDGCDEEGERRCP